MDAHKMWRMLLWIFLGNGGYRHQAWHQLKDTYVGRKYRKGDRQPLEVLRWCIRQTTTLTHMQVFGSDGLDKKSRLSRPRILYLLDWHDKVPALVDAFNAGGSAFHTQLCSVKGFGDLTRKELLIILGAAKSRSIQRVGQELLPFGQGAKNGALAFLKVPQHHGCDAAQVYAGLLKPMRTDLEKHIGELFPDMPKRLCSVTLGDIEPCLCAAFVYTRLVKQLRGFLPRGRLAPHDVEGTWEAVEKLSIPAGFMAHTAEGEPVQDSFQPVRRIPYTEWRVPHTMPRSKLNKRRMYRLWATDASAKRRRLG